MGGCSSPSLVEVTACTLELAEVNTSDMHSLHVSSAYEQWFDLKCCTLHRNKTFDDCPA